MKMRVLKWVLVALAFLNMATVARAANQTKETWQVSWDGGKCTIVLDYDAATLMGTVKRKNGCGKLMRKVKSFVYTDESRAEMILFTRRKAKGPMLGSFDKTGKNTMDGMIGDGEPATMFKSASSSVTINLGGNATTDDSGANCVRYANNRSCAIAQDLKDPSIPTFQTMRVEILADQPTFPFSGGRGIAGNESVANGSCREIKKCEKAFNSNEHWCEVVLDGGFFTAWIKRQDDDWVYLRKGC